jgi:aldose 1-epimerase
MHRARGQSLIPWPNRLRDGAYSFGGQSHQLPLSEPEKGNAIHGLVRFANWTIAERDPHRVRMAHVLYPQPGYPFTLNLSIEYTLSERGMTVTTTATNAGTTRCPYGTGAHPYLSVGTELIDSATLKIPAQHWLPSDERGIPTGREPVQGTPYDFREVRSIGDTRLDTGYVDLIRDPDGLARVQLSGPGGRPSVSLWLDRSYGYVMAFTGDSLPELRRRRRGLGIEPMTCAPNAFQTGDWLRSLAPGESRVSRWGIEPAPSAGPGSRTLP